MRPCSPNVFHVTIKEANFHFVFVLDKQISCHFIHLVYLSVLEADVLYQTPAPRGRMGSEKLATPWPPKFPTPTPEPVTSLPRRAALHFQHRVTKVLLSGSTPRRNGRWRQEGYLHRLVKSHQLLKKASHIVASAVPECDLKSGQHRHLQDKTGLRPL